MMKIIVVIKYVVLNSSHVLPSLPHHGFLIVTHFCMAFRYLDLHDSLI